MLPRACSSTWPAFERDNYLLKGGAVLGGGPGGVALHNRELQLMPMPYGPSELLILADLRRESRRSVPARRADGNQVLVDGKLVPESDLKAFRGTIVHDGRGGRLDATQRSSLVPPRWATSEGSDDQFQADV